MAVVALPGPAGVVRACLLFLGATEPSLAHHTAETSCDIGGWKRQASKGLGRDRTGGGFLVFRLDRLPSGRSSTSLQAWCDDGGRTLLQGSVHTLHRGEGGLVLDRGLDGDSGGEIPKVNQGVVEPRARDVAPSSQTKLSPRERTDTIILARGERTAFLDGPTGFRRPEGRAFLEFLTGSLHLLGTPRTVFAVVRADVLSVRAGKAPLADDAAELGVRRARTTPLSGSALKKRGRTKVIFFFEIQKLEISTEFQIGRGGAAPGGKGRRPFAPRRASPGPQ